MYDLNEELARQNAAWEVATDEERKASRAAYISAGWKSCGHDKCRPWSCEK